MMRAASGGNGRCWVNEPPPTLPSPCQAHTETHIQELTHALTHTQCHTHTHARTHTHTHTRTHTHAHTHTRALISHAHKRARAHTHTHTHTLISHSHGPSSTPMQMPPPPLLPHPLFIPQSSVRPGVPPRRPSVPHWGHLLPARHAHGLGDQPRPPALLPPPPPLPHRLPRCDGTHRGASHAVRHAGSEQRCGRQGGRGKEAGRVGLTR